MVALPSMEIVCSRRTQGLKKTTPLVLFSCRQLRMTTSAFRCTAHACGRTRTCTASSTRSLVRAQYPSRLPNGPPIPMLLLCHHPLRRAPLTSTSPSTRHSTYYGSNRSCMTNSLARCASIPLSAHHYNTHSPFAQVFGHIVREQAHCVLLLPDASPAEQRPIRSRGASTRFARYASSDGSSKTSAMAYGIQPSRALCARHPCPTFQRRRPATAQLSPSFPTSSLSISYMRTLPFSAIRLSSPSTTSTTRSIQYPPSSTRLRRRGAGGWWNRKHCRLAHGQSALLPRRPANHRDKLSERVTSS